MSKPRPTLADYVVIAASPVLIMTLVGSLVFFLLGVFYQGQYETRLHVIMALFVMAAVLVARISIEEGREHAALFAIPLGVVTILALCRFVQFQGNLAPFSPLINIALIGLIWFSADRLTWDCTVIDESRDLSGEGLLQTIGMEGPGPTGSNPQEADLAAVTSPAEEAERQQPHGLWRRFLESRRRPHPHGVWVIYFSLAALPLFGLGQWFLRADDLDSRRYVFKLLVLYVASALGLLLTTSFLGLRRYLRQRRLEMPAEMAGVWMGVGATMIVALLLACLLLPRRNPEYSLTQLPALAGSRQDLGASRFGFGHEGPQQHNADWPGNPPPEKPPDAAVEADEKTGHADSSQRRPQDQSPAQDDPGPSNLEGKARAQASQKQDSGRRPTQGKASQENSPASNASPAESSHGKPSETRPSKGRGAAEDSAARGASPGDGQESRQTDRSQRPSPAAFNDRAEGGRLAKQEPGSRTKEPSESRSQTAEERSDREGGTDSSPRPPRFPDPARVLRQFTPGLAGLVRLIYWAAVILVVGYLLWRYRSQVLSALQEFLQSFRDLWSRLFGGLGERRAADQPEATGPVQPPPRPFSAFPDPFLTGMAERWSPDELVRYSFEALEAWAREHGCPRAPDQTPYEFARRIASREARLGQDAVRLSELYNVSAYGRRTVPLSGVSHVRRLWQALRSSTAA